MIVFAVHLNQFGFKVMAHSHKDVSKVSDSLAVKYLSSILGYKDQMNVEGKNTMPAVSNVLDFSHRPEHIPSAVQMQRGFKYRFYPTIEQESQLARVFGHSRFVYNSLLQIRKEAWLKEKQKISFKELSHKLTALIQQNPWLHEVSSRPLQQAVRHLQRAYVNWWQGRAEPPSFKKRNADQSASFTKQGFTFKNGVLRVAKLGILNIVWSQRFSGQPSMVHISKNPSGLYHVSFQVDEPLDVMPKSDRQVGIDLGLTCFAAFDDGEKAFAPHPLLKNLKRLRRIQQTLSRRKKGSKNREKARIKVAKIHQRIADIRSDFLHKLSTRLVRENQTIAVETLNVRGMVRNHHLAQRISDSGWSEFVRQLEYKSKWHGRTFIRVGSFFPSSKACNACGLIVESLPLNIRSWVCKCGAQHDRDTNAARNILAAGLAVSACGADVSLGQEFLPKHLAMKQEPTEATQV